MPNFEQIMKFKQSQFVFPLTLKWHVPIRSAVQPVKLSSLLERAEDVPCCHSVWPVDILTVGYTMTGTVVCTQHESQCECKWMPLHKWLTSFQQVIFM